MTTIAAASPQLSWPNRPETWDWPIYDRDDNPLGELVVSSTEAPTIVNDTTRSIRRNIPRVVIPPRPREDVDSTRFYAEDLDTLSMSVKPRHVLGDGTVSPVGTFIWGDDSQVQWSSGSPRICALTDLCTNLDQPLETSVGFGVGASVLDAIEEVLDDENISTAGVDGTDATFGVAVGWAAGRDTTLTVLDGLCKNAGFLPPYYDNNGVLQCRIAPNVATATPEFAYGFGVGGVVPGSAVFSNDLLTAPNRYVVIGGNPDAELVGIFDVPDAAPNSFYNTGRIRRKSDTVQGISTQPQADQAAAAAYASDISTYTWLSFDARIDPRHDTWNIVSYDGVNYREVGWTIHATPGGTMNHALRGTYG